MAQCSFCLSVEASLRPLPSFNPERKISGGRWQATSASTPKLNWRPSRVQRWSVECQALEGGIGKGIQSAPLPSSLTKKTLKRMERGSIVVYSGADTPMATAGKEIVPDNSLQVPLGLVALSLGLFLLSYGFCAYFQILGGSEWSALMLTYGFPTALIGAALKYAELKPVTCITYADAYALRDTQMTAVQEQLRSDVTRFRYGDEQHLDEALKRIFRYGQAGGIQRKNAPKLTSIREEVAEGNRYTLVLVFEAPALSLQDFMDRQEKFKSFFGPGIIAEIAEAKEKVFEVSLISDGTAPKPAQA